MQPILLSKKYSLLFLKLTIGCLFLASCEGTLPINPDILNDSSFVSGWIATDDASQIPVSTNFGFGSSNNLPPSVDLTKYFPPVGNQGYHGTCVAWATGYNTFTAMRAIKNRWGPSALSSTRNQASPKDLFLAIPENEKSRNCGGTNFGPALNVLQQRGVASLQTVPYISLGNCSDNNLNPSWANEASQNKIKYWRRTEVNVESFKQNLANNIPVVIGIKVFENFQRWRGDGVLTFSDGKQGQSHALVIVGYNDYKGSRGAFRVLNSWGTDWGDQGFAWIDYNYLVNELCGMAFMMALDESEIPDNNNNTSVSGVDVAPWVLADYSSYQQSGYANERKINFNLYNIGSQAATPDKQWSFYYIYYNAYDANDYGVIFFDEFKTTVGSNTFACQTNYNCVFNYSIPAGGNFAHTIWGTDYQTRTYYMPQITGYYYLVLIADAGDQFNEQNEANNLFYTTTDPKYFENGYSLRIHQKFEFKNPMPLQPNLLTKNVFNSAVNQRSKNAYTPQEILNLIKREKKNGNISKKVNIAINRGKTSY